jgi:hypothetical protein
MTTIITKAAFARACNISKGRVSQYIRAGQLTSPALVGQGREQKVDLELGREQLKLRLDTDQRFLNGLNTRLDDPPPVKTEEDRLAGELAEFFEAAIPGLVTALADRLKVSESVAYLIGEEWFDAIEAVRAG